MYGLAPFDKNWHLLPRFDKILTLLTRCDTFDKNLKKIKTISSTVAFVPKGSDNGGQLRCEATNIVSMEPLVAVRNITVDFASEFFLVFVIVSNRNRLFKRFKIYIIPFGRQTPLLAWYGNVTGTFSEFLFVQPCEYLHKKSIGSARCSTKGWIIQDFLPERRWLYLKIALDGIWAT